MIFLRLWSDIYLYWERIVPFGWTMIWDRKVPIMTDSILIHVGITGKYEFKYYILILHFAYFRFYNTSRIPLKLTNRIIIKDFPLYYKDLPLASPKDRTQWALNYIHLNLEHSLKIICHQTTISSKKMMISIRTLWRHQLAISKNKIRQLSRIR